jgi:DNA repair protein RecN (Recombination protein N)
MQGRINEKYLSLLVMLQKIQIQNYAIIDELGVDFGRRLNVITGETGAGKSILMGAMSLILGDRADGSALMSREKKCVVEGVFLPGGRHDVMAFLGANDLDVAGEEVVVRREIAPNGKSRAFVNDTPVNLDQLRRLGSMLVDLHRQFDTLELGESDFQREVLDALAGNGEALSVYRGVYQDWQSAKRELATLQEQQLQFNKELDYNKFLFDELSDAGLRDNELEELDRELKLLSHSEEIKLVLTGVYNELSEGERPVVQELRSLVHKLQAYATWHPELQGLAERMMSAQIELQDISGELERINEEVNHDPRRIEEINERLSTGYKLMKKHGVATTAALLDIRRQLEHKLQDSLQLDAGIAAGEKEVGRLSEEVKKKAQVLSKGRHAQMGLLEGQVNKLLKQVGMPSARLKVQIRAVEPDADGMDAIEFLFDANKSERFEPIRKVASGGELSRLMLCIKSLVAESIDLPTLIFDEIDTGISGEAARQVGIILKNLAKQRQVVCITHQPQIAGKGDTHFFVYKAVKDGMVRTQIRLLNQDERITAIAQMLSGAQPTAAAIENAREMVLS